MLLTEKIEYTPFSPSEQTIIDFILKHGVAIENLTTTQIAEQTFSSKSTLVRIAKKLNFKGWNDFKLAYLKELAYLNKSISSVDANHPFSANDNYLTIINRLASLKKDVIDDTLDLNSFKQLSQAISLLKQAQTIHVFAASNNILLTQEFQLQMKRIGKDVRVHGLHGEVRFDALLAKKDSCALIVSYSGETKSLIDIAQILRDRQVPILLLTSLGDNSLTSLASTILRLSTREKLYSKINSFATNEAIVFLLDFLYAGIFTTDYQANLELRTESSRFIENERGASSLILAEDLD